MNLLCCIIPDVSYQRHRTPTARLGLELSAPSTDRPESPAAAQARIAAAFEKLFGRQQLSLLAVTVRQGSWRVEALCGVGWSRCCVGRAGGRSGCRRGRLLSPAGYFGVRGGRCEGQLVSLAPQLTANLLTLI
jgi:hypothetical protein